MNDYSDDAMRRLFDDDRLLAYALGLEADAALERALADDAGLRARLEAVQGELDAIASGISSAVPPEPPAYADLAAPRWQKLRPYLEHRTRRTKWGFPLRRVASSASAVAIVALVAVFVVRPALEHTRQTQSPTGVSAVKNGPEMGNDQMSGAGSMAAAGSITAPAAAVAEAARTVVVIRAGAQDGTRQEVTVLRVLKGVKPVAGRLTVPATGALTAGERYIVYLPDPATIRALGGAMRYAWGGFESTLGSAARSDGAGSYGATGSATPQPYAGTAAPSPPAYSPAPALPGSSPVPGSVTDPFAFAFGGDLSLVVRWSGLPVFVESVPAGTRLDSISLP